MTIIYLEVWDMRFTCEKSLLNTAIATASRAAAAKSAIQSLEGLLIEATDNITVSRLYHIERSVLEDIYVSDYRLWNVGIERDFHSIKNKSSSL